MAQQHTNRLSRETSPYLLQHAHNPVDWYAWGPEAFAAAKQQNKSIFLSVGYSTCYWCHVMERESFENPQIAAQMNRSFVCIKVDREERPDVDQLYMAAVQLITHSGGWPMSVFLTPELAPFYGGTYFPPGDYAGRPGFPTLLRSISEAWETRWEEVERSAQSLVAALERYGRPGGAQVAISMDEAFIDNMIGRSVSDYDRQFGGFGAAPKFPRETLLELLLAYCDNQPRSTPAKVEIAQMLGHTLEMMARGGIRDQLGGGFHRYSTDERWLVPHFEIMLYDNAMLLGVYAWASRLPGREDFAVVARGIADFVLGEMAGAGGEFFTAFDAEVDGREGQTYLWTRQQVAEVLSESETAIFARAYGLDLAANFVDPHHGSGRAEANVLYLAQAGDESQLAPIRAKLLEARKRRKQPALDTKVLTGWNGLMIRNLAMAGRMLGERRYVDAAARAMRFVLQRHRMADGGLYHGSRDGEAKVAGFLDDYAAIALALAELHATTGEMAWMNELEALLAQVQRRFGSSVGAFYFTDTQAADLPVRQMVAADSPLPSGNAMMALVFARLGRTKQAAQIVSCFADALDTQGEAHSTLVQAAMACIARQGAIHVAPRDVVAEMQTFTDRAKSAVKVSATKLDGRRYRVNVSIADGFHIYAGEHLRLSANAPAQVAYPPATARPGDMGVYEGEIPIDLTLEQEQSVLPQIYLDYQVCTETECLPRTRVEVRA